MRWGMAATRGIVEFVRADYEANVQGVRASDGQEMKLRFFDVLSKYATLRPFQIEDQAKALFLMRISGDEGICDAETAFSLLWKQNVERLVQFENQLNLP